MILVTLAALVGASLWAIRPRDASPSRPIPYGTASRWYDSEGAIPRPKLEPLDLHWNASDGRDPTHVEPGYVVAGMFVGEHRRQVQRSGPCPLQVAPNICRYLPDADVQYDRDGYIEQIRIHQKQRGGIDFNPKEWETRTNTAEMGMTEERFLRRNPVGFMARDTTDPEFGPVRIYAAREIQYEFDLVSAERVLAAIDLFR